MLCVCGKNFQQDSLMIVYMIRRKWSSKLDEEKVNLNPALLPPSNDETNDGWGGGAVETPWRTAAMVEVLIHSKTCSGFPKGAFTQLPRHVDSTVSPLDSKVVLWLFENIRAIYSSSTYLWRMSFHCFYNSVSFGVIYSRKWTRHTPLFHLS